METQDDIDARRRTRVEFAARVLAAAPAPDPAAVFASAAAPAPAEPVGGPGVTTAAPSVVLAGGMKESLAAARVVAAAFAFAGPPVAASGHAPRQSRRNRSRYASAGTGKVITQTGRHIVTTGQVGRNDPCPCGAGKKFKRCCQAKFKGLNLVNPMAAPAPPHTATPEAARHV